MLFFLLSCCHVIVGKLSENQIGMDMELELEGLPNLTWLD